MDIIAEVGSNWYKQDPEEAKKLAISAIAEAAWAKATIVKFQMFRAESLYAHPDKRIKASQEQKDKISVIREGLKDFELPGDWIKELIETAHNLGLQFWLSCFSLPLLEKFGPLVDGIKIASGDLDFYDLTDAAGRIASSYGKKVCLSTGAATWPEIESAVRVISTHKRPVVMHCVSAYPADEKDMNLKVIRELGSLGEKQVSGIGLSDHSQGFLAAQLALVLGATYFEKHFRPSGAEDNPDFDVSVDKGGLKAYVNALRKAEDMYGLGKMSLCQMAQAEKDERIWARRGEDDLRPRL